MTIPSRPFPTVAVTTLLLVLALQLLHVACTDSATWDEAHHLVDGYRIWTQHDYRLNAEVPPLVKLTAALPLLPLHLTNPAPQAETQAQNAFRAGRAFVVSNGGDRVLLPARLACAVFPLLLAWLLYAATRSLFGTPAALLALALFVFDPNVLANGTLVTTDLGSACLLFATVFAFYRYVQTPTPARLALTGLLAGLTLVAKYTGILIAPTLLLLAAAEALRTRSLRTLARHLAACVAILLCAWLVLWTFYGFRYAAAPHGLAISPALTPYLQAMPNPRDGVRLALLARHHLLPEAYLWGLANTRYTEWEYTSYFFGRIYRHGPWQYFPAAFLIKSTLPLLLLLALAPVLWLRSRTPPQPPDHSAPQPPGRSTLARKLAFLLLPVCVYFAVITGSHFDIGARHLMPVYPFLYALAGAAAALALRRGPAGRAAVAVLLLWQVVTSARVAPDYMAFGNEAMGGPAKVHRYLSDANVDWGQQLKAVKRFLDTNHITTCWFAYFPDGAVEPADYGIPCRRLPTGSSLEWLNLPMQVPPVIDGTVLISDSDLEGVEFGDGPLNPYDSFRGLHPAAVIEHGVNVYQGRFAVPLASALIDVRTSGELAHAGQLQPALDLATRAATLAPTSAITQLNLAERLAATAQWPEALLHYQTANHLVQTIRPDLEESYLQPAITTGLTSTQTRLQPPRDKTNASRSPSPNP